MPTMIDPHPMNARVHVLPDSEAAPPSAAEMRGGIRRLRLQGATTYACRHCRTPIRVVSAAYLPERAPSRRRV
jgi:hypothetical protein